MFNIRKIIFNTNFIKILFIFSKYIFEFGFNVKKILKP